MKFLNNIIKLKYINFFRLIVILNKYNGIFLKVGKIIWNVVKLFIYN